MTEEKIKMEFKLKYFDSLQKWTEVNKIFDTKENALKHFEELKEQNNNIIDCDIKEFCNFDKRKVTVYTTGSLFSCPNKIIGYLLEVGYTKYAQHERVPYCIITPKGKRNPIRLMKGSYPFILITDKWEDRNPPSWNNTPTDDGNGVITSSSKYSSFDERYIYDFNTWFKSLNSKILFDERYNKQTNED